MSRLLLTLVVLTLCLVPGIPVSADERASDLDGIWHPMTAVLMGQELPQEVREGIVLKLAGDQYTVTVNGTPDKGACVVKGEAVCFVVLFVVMLLVGSWALKRGLLVWFASV